MAKRGRKPNPFDYKETAEHCSKELAEKKKALIKAEKTLAKAQQAHQDLLSEVARLDMLDRSLRAVNEKTQPPQSVRYVYSYPQWVWNPYTYVPNGGQWTITTQPYQGSLLTGGLPNNGLTGGLQNGYNSGSSVVTTNADSSAWTLGTLNSGGPALSCTLSANDAPVTQTFTGMSGSSLVLTSNAAFCNSSATPSNGGGLVIDLSTHADQFDTNEGVPKYSSGIAGKCESVADAVAELETV